MGWLLVLVSGCARDVDAVPDTLAGVPVEVRRGPKVDTGDCLGWDESDCFAHCDDLCGDFCGDLCADAADCENLCDDGCRDRCDESCRTFR